MGFALTSSRRSLLLLTLAAIAAPAMVSQTQPTAPPPLAPQLVQFQNPIAAGQLAFLSGYAGRTTKELLKDKQFRALKKEIIPRTEYHYGSDMALSDALDNVLQRISTAGECA